MELRNVEPSWRASACASASPACWCCRLRPARGALRLPAGVRHDDYATQAEDNRISIVPIVPNRGLILDRNGIVLARNYSAYTLEIMPAQGEQPRAHDRRGRASWSRSSRATAPLQEAAGRDARTSRACRSAPSYRRGGRHASPPSATASPGVEIKARLFRQYPCGEIGSHVLGYIGRINQAEKERLEEDGVDAELPRHRLHRQARRRGELRERAARHDRLRAGRDRRRRARHAHAFAHAVAAGQQRRADARHAAAAGGRAGVRRPARRAGGDRALDRRGARLRVQARLRSRTCSSTASTRRTGPSSTTRPTSRCYNRALRRDLSARLHLQALHGARRARDRQAHARSSAINDPGYFDLRRPALPRLQGRRPWLWSIMYKSIVRVLRHVLLHARERHGHRRHRAPT